MTEMLERVAKAIYEADDPWSTAFEWPTMGGEGQSAENYRRIARAAIEAMREPTDAQLAAFTRSCDSNGQCLVKYGYSAMITAALSPKP